MGRTRIGVYDDDASYTAREFHEADCDTWSGLYDASGNRLHREPPRIGFDPHRWDAPRRKSRARTKA